MKVLGGGELFEHWNTVFNLNEQSEQRAKYISRHARTQSSPLRTPV